MEITYTTGDCLLGKFLVATTRKGICMIAIGKSDSELERRLFDSFPYSDPRRDDRGLASVRRTVERRISGKDLDKKLPVDLHGTPFQVAIWKEMLKIPAGRTRSSARDNCDTRREPRVASDLPATRVTCLVSCLSG